MGKIVRMLSFGFAALGLMRKRRRAITAEPAAFAPQSADRRHMWSKTARPASQNEQRNTLEDVRAGLDMKP